ncbi:hypothetical protein BO221_11310 [Archangium sp. Cb G35]|nr:hypothetical protein BO221_11310 [Archangium sp. Cb G35]
MQTPHAMKSACASARETPGVWCWCVLVVLLMGCVSKQRHWEEFRGSSFEQLRRDYACAVSMSYEPPMSNECLRISWTAMRMMEQHQQCSADSDCIVRSLWPPVSPCCTAVNRAWILGQEALDLERDVEGVCGYVDRICARASSCEARCVKGQCALRNPEPYLIPADAICSNPS